jgi:hypothetical protein
MMAADEPLMGLASQPDSWNPSITVRPGGEENGNLAELDLVLCSLGEQPDKIKQVVTPDP